MSSDALPPPPTGDLDSPGEVAEMVRRFYADVAQDRALGPMFNDVAKVDWSEHLPKLTLFWCRALFGTPGYVGNPYRQHALVNTKRAFRPSHFRRWLELFNETVDLGWVGPNAEHVKVLAANVARVHQAQLLGDLIPVEGIPGDGEAS